MNSKTEKTKEIVEKTKEIVIQAAKKEIDPVVLILKKIGFRERGSNGKTKRFVCTLPGGFNASSFIGTLNYLLKKNKTNKDKLFFPPDFNGYYILSSAHYQGKDYSLEIGIGFLLLTIIGK